MLALFSKTKPWMVLSILTATSAFGASDCEPKNCSRPCPQVCPEPMPAPTIAAYNAPAGIKTACSWDAFADASFIYWQPILENLELGLVNTADTAYGPIFNMDFSYIPGFQVALGMLFDYDNWSGWAEYTWFHGSHHQTATTGSGSNIAPIQLAPDVTSLSASMSTFSRKWRLNMDFVDLLMGREYYVGTKLTFKSFFGARGAWIRQSLNDSFSGPGGVGGSGGFAVSGEGGLGGDTILSTVGTSKQTSHSWAVGPKAGLNVSWLLGEGFRLIGNGTGDILYTRYTKLKNNTSTTTVIDSIEDGIITLTPTLRTQQKNTGYLRTHLELEMGLGWGSYFANNTWHFDLAATYGYQVFFNQNMFRQFVDDVAIGTSFVPNGDLFVHGLNLTARFDF